MACYGPSRDFLARSICLLLLRSHLLVCPSSTLKGTMCLEGGAYVLNLKACASCGERAMPKNGPPSRTEDEDGEETITLTRKSGAVLGRAPHYLHEHDRSTIGWSRVTSISPIVSCACCSFLLSVAYAHSLSSLPSATPS